MHIDLRPTASVRPYDRNPRHNKDAVAAVAESIRRFGFRQPVVVDAEGVIVCGHTRWKAAGELGLEQIPVHVASDLTPEQVRAYRVADNKTAEIASWDIAALSGELGEMLSDPALDDLDWTLLGFDPDELARLTGTLVTEGLTDPDDVPLPPDKPVTRPGDLVILGDHRLLCADSSSREDLARLLDGGAVHLVNTDPPYNVKVEPRSNNAIAAGNSSFTAPEKKHHQKFDLARHPEKAKPTAKKMRAKDRPLINDFVTDEEFARLLLAWFGNAADALEPGRGFYIWGGYANIANYPSALKASGLYFSQAIIWHKMHPVLTRKDFMGDHEWCFYGWKEGAAHVYLGPNNIPDVWSIKKVNPQSMMHLTEKPVDLARRAIEYSSRPGETVLDLFGGSGSTLIACEQTARHARLMEIDPAYCDVIVERWEKFTGRKAERFPSGSKEPFDARSRA
ncbi:MAG: ParB N-terminal domain-containing protein [Phycisphaeraceae bacterium]|nr:ParB N-terminal domain-containing protein [Phycisphaeraceae bacterium]